jgi:hypothetical protein
MAKGFVSKTERLTAKEKRLVKAARARSKSDEISPSLAGTRTAKVLGNALNRLKRLQEVANAEIREKEKARMGKAEALSQAAKPKPRGKNEIRTRSAERGKVERKMGVRRGS